MAAQFSQTTRSLDRDRSPLAIGLWLAVGALLAGWLHWFLLGTVTVYEVSTHARLEVQQAPHPVFAVVPRMVLSTSLVIGAEVEAGQVLVALDDSSEQLRLREERARLDAIPLQMASLRRQILSRQREKLSDRRSAAAATEAATFRSREADAAMSNAQDYEQRAKRLTGSGLLSPAEMARALADTKKLTASRDSLVSDARRIELEAQTRLSQHDATIESLNHSVAALEGEMAAAGATIQRLERDIEKHVVRAPIAGRLGSVVPLQPGAYVTEGQQLATVVPSGDLIVVADFNPTLALGRIREGQQARLRLDGFPWAQYGSLPATVSKVSSEIRNDLVRVELALEPVAPGAVPLQHGLPGSVEVTVEAASPASLALRAAGLLFSNPAPQTSLVAESVR
ncbi:MAG: HlyD family efflux transporter periplasmic adaptor subunit [Vicinamibacterales bacterium]